MRQGPWPLETTFISLSLHVRRGAGGGIALSGGGSATLPRIDIHGEFISDPVLSSAISFDRIDHYELTRDEFFVGVEAWRTNHLKGKALFDIYRRMRVLAAAADTQRRAFTEENVQFSARDGGARALHTRPRAVELSPRLTPSRSGAAAHPSGGF